MTYQFTSDNQPDPSKKKRGPSKKTLFRNALEANGSSEVEFYELMVKESLDALKSPERFIKGFHNDMMKEILARLIPPDKTTLPKYEIEGFVDAKTEVDRMDCIINACATGGVPPDIAKIFTDLMRYRMEILEITELRDRLEKIEDSLKEQENV